MCVSSHNPDQIGLACTCLVGYSEPKAKLQRAGYQPTGYMGIVILVYSRYPLFLPTTGQQKHTLIIGDGIISQVGGKEHQLLGGGITEWNGLPGGNLEGVCDRLNQHLAKYPVPTTIIIHLGSDDIFKKDLGYIRTRLEETIKGFRKMLPNTRLIWSDILPRQKYENENEPGAGKRSTRNLNSFGRRVMSKMENCKVIKHGHVIRVTMDDMFGQDEMDLSEKGKVTFRNNLEQALVFFKQNPEKFHFPAQQNTYK